MKAKKKKKLKSFCSSKETVNKKKIQPTDWGEILAYDTSDKGLIPKIYQQFIQFKNKNKQSNQKMT